MLPNQEHQLHAAYMAGVSKTLDQFAGLADLPEADGVKALEALHQEMRDIANAIVKGADLRTAQRQ